MRPLLATLFALVFLLQTSAFAHHPVIIGEEHSTLALLCSNERVPDCPEGNFVQELSRVEGESIKRGDSVEKTLEEIGKNEFLLHMLQQHCQYFLVTFTAERVIDSWQSWQFPSPEDIEKGVPSEPRAALATALDVLVNNVDGEQTRMIALIFTEVREIL